MGEKSKKGKKVTVVKDKKPLLGKEKSEENLIRGILPDRDLKKNLGCG